MEIDVADRADDEEYGGREIEMDGEVVAKVFGTTDFEITQKEIVAGDGIEVTEEDNVITISATGETEIEAGAGIEVDEGTVSVNPDGVSIETRSGSEVSDQKVQLLGFNSISNYRTETTVGDDLLAESESGDLSIVASLVGSAYVIRYKPLGILDIDGAEGSGLEVTRESESGSNSMKLDLADRGQTSFGVHDVNVGGSSTGVKVFSSEDVDVLDIEAGDGIQVSKSGNKATVSLTGGAITDVVSGSDEISCSKSGSVITVTFNQDESESESETDGYTGTETVVTGVTYDTGTHQLSRTFKTWTFSNGILTSVSEAQTAVIETAVQEASDGR